MKEYFIWLMKLITLVLIFFVVVPVLLVGVITGLSESEKALTAVTDGKKQVAVVEVLGLIETSKPILEELYKQAKNEKVQGIVLQIDSPGGTVGASQDIFRAVGQLKAIKPVVISMGTVAASGGLYAAVAGSRIFAQPGTITGSIGVMMQIPNVTKISDLVGLQMITMKTGQFKDTGNMFREMTPEDKAFLEHELSVAYKTFVDDVSSARKIDREKVLSLADGRTLLGSEAKEAGLVDDFGNVYDAARSVYEILGKPLPEKEYPELIYTGDKYAQFKKLLEGVTSIPSMFSRGRVLKYQMY